MVEASSGATTEGTAAPRPRRRREQSEASAFLSKTYTMIDNLPDDIGGWSDAGDSMVILDAERFAAEIIPQYFKHNNFRSFVRQLNFYGFRKLRADSSAPGGANASRWEFKHGNFRRGQPELLVQIRRAEHYDYLAPDAAAQRQRQTELERDVADLKNRVNQMQTSIDNLNAITQKLSDALIAASGLKRGASIGLDSRLDSLEGLGLDSIPSFSELEGKPLKRSRVVDAIAVNDSANDVLAVDDSRLEGEPLSRRMSTFETSRLDSLIRTLDDDGTPVKQQQQQQQLDTDVVEPGKKKAPPVTSPAS